MPQKAATGCCCAIRVSVDALCALLDCALGFFPCYLLFGCKQASRGRYGGCLCGLCPYCVCMWDMHG